MKGFTHFIVIALVTLFISCAVSENPKPRAKNIDSADDNANSEALKEKTSPAGTSSNSEKKTESQSEVSAPDPKRVKECRSVDTGDRFVLKKQTFPIDFKPFEKSCFVTSHDPEYEDPPFGSVIEIFKDGKRVFEFDSRFNPEAATCWVKGVAFEDLTEDGVGRHYCCWRVWNKGRRGPSQRGVHKYR